MTPRVFDPAKHCGHPRRTTGIGARDPGKKGEPCRRARGWGTDHLGYGHCRIHTGATINGKREAAREAAQQALQKLGVEVHVDPRTALLAMVREAVGNVIFLRERLRGLGFEVVGRIMRDTRSGDPYTTSEEPRALFRMYGEWADRVVKYSKAAIDTGVAEARLELERQTVEAIVRVVTLTLDAAQVTGEQRERAVQVAVNELRSIEATVPAGSAS